MNISFVQKNNCDFILNNEIFKFIGCNMYELAYVDTVTTTAMLKDAADEGFSVVRFWAFGTFESIDKNKLKEICDISKELNLKIIPVLSDSSGYNQTDSIDNIWYKEGYKINYVKYIKDLISDFKNRDEILLWEIINEPITNSFEDIFNFTENVSGIIRSIDPNHLISIGTIGGIGDKFGNAFSRFSISNFEKLYSLKNLDAISLHDYSFNSTVFERLDILYRFKGKLKNAKLYESIDRILNYIPNETDKFTLNKFNKTFDFPLTLRQIWRSYNSKNIAISKKLNKPIYIGEVGFKKSLGKFRKIILEQELKKYFKSGISGVLLWSFESQGKSIDGHGYGFNSDDGFSEVIKSINLFSNVNN